MKESKHVWITDGRKHSDAAAQDCYNRRMHIYAIGTMPKWAQTLIDDYRTRLPSKGFWSVSISSLRAKPQGKHNITANKQAETKLLMGHLSPNAHTILLDATGTSLTSSQFAAKLVSYQKSIEFVIGGADGIDHDLCTVNESWSLSHLTLTHVFARMLLLEQLYRAYSIHQNHPYHK